MNVVLIIALLIILWLIIEILSIVLKMTGLDLNKARFQVISIITHTGFTTRESELIAQHPLRRRIASILMVISYLAEASFITVLFSTLLNNRQQLLSIILYLVASIAFITFVTRNKYFANKFNKVVEKIISKRILKHIDKKPIDEIFKTNPGYGVYELIINDKSPLVGVTLKEARLKDKYIQVLKIERGAKDLDFPKADTKILLGDKLIVYGKIKSILRNAVHH